MKDIKYIRKAFKTQLKVKFNCFNDLNKDKTIRKIKITGIYDLNYKWDYYEPLGTHNHLFKGNTLVNTYVSFIKNELGIDNVEVKKDKWGLNNIVFKIENK